MSELRAAHRYALAILETGHEQAALDRVSKDFESIDRLIRESREFLLFLRSPVINKEKKKSILAGFLEKSVSGITYKFILLLTSKGRETILPEIIQQFYRLCDVQLGIENAAVRSAVPLTAEQEKKLLTRLEQRTKKKIHLHTVIDPKLKGGITIQIGDTVWDGSILHQLETLRERFTEGVAYGKPSATGGAQIG